MKKISSLILALLMLLPCLPGTGAHAAKYEMPGIYPASDTFVRVNGATINYAANETLVVDNSKGNHRIAFLKFSLEGYENELDTADDIRLRILSSSDAGGDGYAFSVYPLSGSYKNMNLETLTYNDAAEVQDGGVCILDYAPETEVYQGKAYHWYDIGVKEYCLAQEDKTAVFMIRSVNGAFSFYSSESKENEPQLVIENGFTGLKNQAWETGKYIAELFDGIAVSSDVEFLAEYAGNDICYTSGTPSVITDGGEVLERPKSAEGDASVRYSVQIQNREYPEIREETEFTVRVLKQGSTAANDVAVSDSGIQIDFKSFPALTAGKRALLRVNHSCLKPGVGYELYSVLDGTRNLIGSFTPRGDTTGTLIDVTDALAAVDKAGFYITGGGYYYETKEKPVLLEAPEEEAAIMLELDSLNLGDLSQVKERVELPAKILGTDISWRSSDRSVIAESGRVERPAVDTWVELTAELKTESYSYQKVFQAYVLRENTDSDNNEFPALADPMHMPDERLFGAWDEGTNTWTEQPILMYDEIPGLAHVEACAKSGNYIDAKALLLAYFRTKNGDEIYTYEPDDAYQVKANALAEKMYGWLQMDDFVSELEVGSEWGWYTFDLTDIARIRSAYWIMDSEMDGSYLEIASRENENGCGAYLEIISNGSKRIYPVIADTYISAGENADTVYGDSPVLYCREEAENGETPFSSGTARPYFRFDTRSDYENVSSVKLSFYGRSVGRVSKKVYLMTTSDYRNFEEDELFWSMHYPQVFNFKQTGYIWRPNASFHQSKWHTSFEWLNYSSRLNQCQYLLNRYMASGDERFAYSALDFVISLYAQQPRAVYPRVLEGGWRTEQLIKTIYTSINSYHMTPEVFTALVKYLYIHGEELQDRTVSSAANWDSAIQVNLARICAFFPEISQDGWWENVREKLYHLYSKGIVNEDGSYTESTSSYIGGVMNEFKSAIEIIRTAEGVNSEYYQFFAEMYRTLMTYYMNLAYANGQTVPYGDGSRDLIRKSIGKYVDFLYDAEGEYFATEGEKGTRPDYTSVLYPAKAVAMLRSGWHKDDLCAFISNDNGGSHGHRDDLSLDVTAFDKFLLVEAGGSAYSEGSEFAQRRFDTIYHNTIEIDNKNQDMYAATFPGGMELKSNDSFDLLWAGNTSIYKGFDVNRKVLMLKNKFLIVSDYIFAPDGPHTYRQAWHPDEDANLELNKETGAAATHYAEGANIKIIPADPEASEPVIFPRLISDNTEMYALQYARENVEGDQTYDTVLYPEAIGEDASVSVSRLYLGDVPKTKATALEIKIDDITGSYYSSNEEQFSVRRFGTYQYDGEMAYVETDDEGTLNYFALTLGAELTDGEDILFRSEQPVRDLAVQYEGTGVRIFSSEDLPQGGISIAAPRRADKVYVNGTEVEYTLSDGKIVTKGEKKSDSSYEGIKPGSPGGQGKPTGNSGQGGTGVVPPTATPTPPPSEKTPLSDVDGHWAEEAIRSLYDKGIVSGDGQGRFWPERSVTRAEFTKLIVCAAGLPISNESFAEFTDVADGAWYAPYVAAANSLGIVSGFEDDTFRPNHFVTRQEMAKMLVLTWEYLELPDRDETAASFADEDEIAAWAREYVKHAARLGLFTGDDTGCFRPDSNATRAEAVAVIARLLQTHG